VTVHVNDAVKTTASQPPAEAGGPAYLRDIEGALVPRMGYQEFLDRTFHFVMHELDHGWASGNAYKNADGTPVPGY
jgi:hypothetical protein